MKFMILMSDDPSWDALNDVEQARVIEAHTRFEADLHESGSFVSSARFGPGPGRAIVKAANGETSASANPAQGKGAVGGYYLVDVQDMDEALKWAERCRFIAGPNWVYPIWESEDT